MKKVIAITMILLLLNTVLPGCTQSGEEPAGESRQTSAGNSRIIIYTSFYPMYFLASEIAGDKAKVISMVPAGAEPHDWEPSPRMAAELSKADMFIYNGAGMETWIDNILTIIDKDRTRVVDASEGIALLAAYDNEEGHGDEHEEEEDHDHAHDHDHEHGMYDPHIWVSPLRAIQQAETIYSALAETDPANAEYYGRNMKELDSKLEELDNEIRDAVKSFKSNVIVVSHEAFGYFAADYGLKQVAIRGINPQEEPSPAKMIELVKECRENNVKHIFFERLTSPKLSETLAKELGAETSVLSDITGLNEKDIKAGKNYITEMYENLENLKKALGD